MREWSKPIGRKAMRLWTGAAAVLASAIPATGAHAYVGESFLAVPGERGGWRGEAFRNAIRAEAHYWLSDTTDSFGRRGGASLRQRMFFSGPVAPEKGPHGLVLSVDKRSPALAGLMARCRTQAVIPEATYAESSQLARSPIEIGPRPAGFPEWYQYRLSRVKIADCPVVADAPEQALVLKFEDIAWLNYSGSALGQVLTLQPPVWTPVAVSGETRTFVVSWFGVANDVADDQCAALNPKPGEADYYALMPPEMAAKERVENAKEGGVGYESGQMEWRGPNKLNAVKLPGIVRDPGMLTPRTRLARGLDLDGDDGRGRAPASICRHTNYDSPDGRKGIDNQLYTVQGCYSGWQGRKGFYYQYANEQRRNGSASALISLSGIDDPRNDDEIYVTVLYSKDPMAKSANGAIMLADYTFRLTDNPEYSYFTHRAKGRIADGVIETESMPRFSFHAGLGGELKLHHAAMRLEIGPDGFLKGVLAGYQDWRDIMKYHSSSRVETNFNVNVPAIYNALRRYADGLKDPVTGQCQGVSSAYDIEASPAFVPPRQMQQFVTQLPARQGASR